MSKKIIIGSDHAGFGHKSAIVQKLKELGYQVEDVGPSTADAVDYPDFAHPVATAVEEGIYPSGILVCGSGNGVAMTANKHQGIRAALCWNEELASLAKAHNNANILCVPARFVSEDLAFQMVEAFLNTSFEGGRHQNRVAKIHC